MSHLQESLSRFRFYLTLILIVFSQVGLCLVFASTQNSNKEVKVVINQIESSRYPIVKAYISVLLGRQSPVLGLTSDSFSLFEDHVKVKEFELLIPDDKEGLAIVLALDTSGSMKNNAKIEQAKSAAKRFINQLTKYDECAIISFDDSIKNINDFTQNTQVLLSSIDKITAQNNTRLYDAIYQSIETLSSNSGGRKALIVLTDGKDEGSMLLQDDCINYANEENIPVYSIAFGPDALANIQSVARVSQLTGGEYFYASIPENLSSFYEKIAQRLQRQYIFQFKSKLYADGQWHTLRLEVNDANYVGYGSKNYHLPNLPLRITMFGILFIIIIVSIIILFIVFLSLWFLRKHDLKKRQRFVENELVSQASTAGADINTTEDLLYGPTRRYRIQQSSTSDRSDLASDKTIQANRSIFEVSSYTLEVILSNGTHKEIELDEKGVTIGSSVKNDIVIKGKDVSSKHAKIEKKDGDWILSDFETKTGTSVNNKKINSYTLQNEDKIKIGKTIMIIKRKI